MIQTIKQYLLTNQPIDFPDTLLNHSLQHLDESILLWKNGILKFRGLSDSQHNLVISLYQHIQMNPQYQQQYIITEEQLSSYIMLTKLFRNYLQSKYPSFEQEVYTQLLMLPVHSIVINKLLLLGQQELICQHIFNGHQSIIQHITDKYNLDKLIKYFLLYYIDKWELISQSLNNCSDLLQSIIFSAKVKSATEQYMYLILQQHYTQEQIKSMYNIILKQWSNSEFIRHAAIQTQIYVSNLIVLFIKNGYTDQLIHVGIEERLLLSNVYALPRQCGLLVWKHFIISLGIANEYANEISDIIELPQQPIVISTQDTQIQPQQSSQVQDEDDEFQQFDINEQQIEISVKSIYDCILALRSDDKQRIRGALNSLPYLIRNGLDVKVHAIQLCDILLKMSSTDDWNIDNQKSKDQSLVALMIMMPDSISECILNRYFGEDCSLGDRQMILQLICQSVDELADNPKKYPLDQYDTYTDIQNQTFHFKQISTTYYNHNTKDDSNRIDKINNQSRRWGHTKRLHNKVQIVEPSLNRFHGMTQYYYFPLMVHAPIKHRLLLMREPLLMQNLIITIIKMLDCSQNSIHLIKLIQEALDFMEAFQRANNIIVVKAKLKLWLKISVLLKKDIVLAYPELLERISHLLTQIDINKYIDIHDQSIQHIYGVIISNFRELLNFQLIQ